MGRIKAKTNLSSSQLILAKTWIKQTFILMITDCQSVVLLFNQISCVHCRHPFEIFKHQIIWSKYYIFVVLLPKFVFNIQSVPWQLLFSFITFLLYFHFLQPMFFLVAFPSSDSSSLRRCTTGVPETTFCFFHSGLCWKVGGSPVYGGKLWSFAIFTCRSAPTTLDVLLHFQFVCSNFHLVNIYFPLGTFSVCPRFLEFLVFFWVSFTCYLFQLVALFSPVPSEILSSQTLTGVSCLGCQVSCWAVRYLMSDEFACCRIRRAVTQIYCLCATEHQTQSPNISQICFKPSRLEDFNCFSKSIFHQNNLTSFGVVLHCLCPCQPIW